VLSFAFRQIHTWEQRIDLVLGWRALAAKHSRALGLPVSTWDENAKFVDQMLSLRSVTAQSGLLTLVCMCLVCALFIPNPCSVLLAAASICSISIGVFGFLAWLGFDLDPVTMVGGKTTNFSQKHSNIPKRRPL
jgi:patched domain-containing protein